MHQVDRRYDWQTTVMQAADFFMTDIPWLQLLVVTHKIICVPSINAPHPYPIPLDRTLDRGRALVAGHY